jgi:hypothetical protein
LGLPVVGLQAVNQNGVRRMKRRREGLKGFIVLNLVVGNCSRLSNIRKFAE